MEGKMREGKIVYEGRTEPYTPYRRNGLPDTDW